MKLTSETLSVLKNFSSINENIMIREGNVLKSMSNSKTVVGKATIDSEFPQDFGIYDLPEFLATLNLVNEPMLTFKKDHVVVADNSGLSKIKYYYTDEDSLVYPPKDINMPEAEIKFTFDNISMDKVLNAARTFKYEDLIITPVDGVLRLTVTDTSNPTAHNFSIDIAGDYDEALKFKIIFNIGNLSKLMMHSDYDVEISRKLISHFTKQQSGVEYWIALEKDSEFN